MAHYDEQREKTMCHIENQVSAHVDADNKAYTCPDCHEMLDEVFDGTNYTYECSYCECEVITNE